MDQNKTALDYLSEAYAQSLEALLKQARLQETPAAAAQKERTAQTLRLAEELLALGILNETITGEYEELNQQIADKRAELQKLYGIAATASSDQAVRQAHEQLRAGFQEELDGEEARFRAEAEALTAETQAAIDEKTAVAAVQLQELEQQTAELRAAWKQESEREKAEFDYQLKRGRAQAQEARAREVEAREAALAQREQEARAALEAVQGRAAELDARRAAAEAIPAQLDAARAEGAEKRGEELEREYGYERALARKDGEHRLRALREELDRLAQKHQAAVAEKAALSQRLDQVNAESRKLTSDTVRSIGGINILNADAGGAAKK